MLMKRASIVISAMLLLLSLPAFSHLGQLPATPQTVLNVPLTRGSVESVGTVDVSTLPASAGPVLGLLPQLPSLGMSSSKSNSAPATPSFSTINVQPGSSFVSVAKSIEGTPGYNPNPCLCAPSDMGLAASSQYVFQMVNLAGTVYTTSGAVAKPGFSLADFWFAPVRSMSDPQVLFDARAGRWLASIIVIVNHVRFAVSATSNPLGTWYIYQVHTPASNILPDQPFIGYSDDKFLIAANDFNFDTNTGIGFPFIGAQYWILNKLQMMAGAFAPDAQTITPDPTHQSVRPMQQLSAGTNAFMAENCITSSPAVRTSICPATATTTAGGMTVFTVAGLPPSATVTTVTVPITQTGFPRNADQPGNPRSLATNDNRIVSAVWNKGRIWTTLNDGPLTLCPKPSCVRLDEIATPVTPASLLQDFEFTSSGEATFYGAVSTDASNNLVVMFETSSSSVNPSLLVTGQLRTDPPDTLAPSRTVQAGSAVDLTTRWGDYYYATTQPGATSTFWVSGGYRTITLFQGWQTRIGQITFTTATPPPPPPC